MTTIFERDDCLVTLEIGDRIEYTVRTTDHQQVISTPLDGLETLAAHLGGEQLADASRSSAERDGFERLMVASIGSALRRWCHQAGLSSVWTVDGRRARREHVVAVVPQPVTGRTITLSLACSPHEGGQVMFTEEYRGPAEVLGYSYTTGLRSADVPRLVDHLETTADRRTAGEPEDRLIAALGELVAQGTINPAAGQGEPRALFETWCREAGVPTDFHRLGVDRREKLVQVPTRPDQVAAVSFSIDSFGKELGFQEGYGPEGETWRDALYQLRFGYDQLGKLLSWLTNQVGPLDERLGPDDAVVAAWQLLAERGELTPRRPMEVHDRVARWLTEAGVEFRSYGSAWRETLLRVHRQPGDCIFTLSLTIDPDRAAEGITFTEFYDYGPSGDDPGREYGYGVHAPYDALEALADAYNPGDGPAQDRLISAFRDLVAAGVLGDGKALQVNQDVVLRGFEAAGVPVTTDTWVWLNSD
ncbi:hypothetical protein [Kribbella sp. NPDC051137]|uniref:hypothetical protein n=1 Tax=Kribbella sp. NPDC051137 TaxID=3155045 RepID=UPI002F5350FA